MTNRPNPFVTRFDLVKPLIEFGTQTATVLEPTIAELIKIRASQINACPTCLATHVAQARKNGETEDRIVMLSAWRGSALYSEKEKAVLAWTEALTRVEETGGPDADFENLKTHFSDDEQIGITLMICAVNAFNRINLGLRVGVPEAARPKVA